MDAGLRHLLRLLVRILWQTGLITDLTPVPIIRPVGPMPRNVHEEVISRKRHDICSSALIDVEPLRAKPDVVRVASGVLVGDADLPLEARTRVRLLENLIPSCRRRNVPPILHLYKFLPPLHALQVLVKDRVF